MLGRGKGLFQWERVKKGRWERQSKASLFAKITQTIIITFEAEKVEGRIGKERGGGQGEKWANDEDRGK